jgi:hypothetical protein
MYTGTLIADLMATVERAEKFVQQRRVVEEADLRRMFELPSRETEQEHIYAGAA